MKAHPPHTKTQLLCPSQQRLGRCQRRAELVAQLCGSGVVLCIDPEKQVHIWSVSLHLIELVDIVECGEGDAPGSGHANGGDGLAWMCEDDAGGVHTQGQDQLDLRLRGAVKSQAQIGEKSQESHVRVAFHG